MAEKRRYPIGIQTFWEMVRQNYVYVDKTEYVYKMASVGKYYFLSRPRRFGKSLLLSTLEDYFEGKRELFEGLKISKLEKDWVRYPVIHLDMSRGKYYNRDRLEQAIDGMMGFYEKKYGIEQNPQKAGGERLINLIHTAYEQTGRQVVVLIDEYDAPMLDTVSNPGLQDQLRELVRDLFSPLKSEAQYLRFVFLTGISKFSQLSVFSELNNLNVISYDPDFEGCCGVTEDEMLSQMKPDIEWLAQETGRTYDQTVIELKRMYDGYHFSKRMADIYNPWSLINAFEKGDIRNFWFSTGTPSSLINLLRTGHLDIHRIEKLQADLTQFDAPTERISDPIPVLFQSGYLTLKEYHPEDGSFTLGFPNEEVYRGFASSLYLYYTDNQWDERNALADAYRSFRRGESSLEDFIEAIRTWYAAIPYSITDKNQNEQLYQSMFYALMIALNADVSAEQQTADGRMDVVLKMQEAIYILEFKYGQTARNAIRQVKEKDYAVVFAADPRPVYAVGLSIDRKHRTIAGYEVDQCK